MFLEFVVDGIPVSLQGKGWRRAAWKRRVAGQARATLAPGTAPLVVPAEISIAYFYVEDIVDVDNIVKPIQDALVGVAFDDDARVVEIRAVKRDQHGQYRLRRVPPALAAALRRADDFVYVAVDAADLREPVT